MTINVGRLMKKSVVKDTQGNIINMLDEVNGGWIIKNRQVVNPARWNEILKKEADRREAAKAVTLAANNPAAPDRTTAPSKVEALEKRVSEMDSKLDKIIMALNK